MGKRCTCRSLTSFCFRHGCSGAPSFLEPERYSASGIDALVTVSFWNTNVMIILGHGSSGDRRLLEPERYSALSMDALVTVGSWNLNVILLWACMLW